MKKKNAEPNLLSSPDVSDEEYPSIEEQLKGKSIWKMLGEARPGEEFARLKWVYGKGKRKRTWDVILTKSEHPVPMEEIAKKFADIIRPALYEFLEKQRTQEMNDSDESTKITRRKKSGVEKGGKRKEEKTCNIDPGCWEI